MTVATDYFVSTNSIVRQIWGKSDTILFIFAGAAAEFALNKAVDWLYFTGRLPADPIGRLFSTVSYARKIVFASREEALQTIDRIRSIHSTVEQNRGDVIPDWAYRDVLFMLIHYSISAFELLERKLTSSEKQDVYEVFYSMGTRMGIPGLPINYVAWVPVRNEHLNNNLSRSKYTVDLFRQYLKHLGRFRFMLLLEGQILVVPDQVRRLLLFRSFSFLVPVLNVYKLTRLLKLDGLMKDLVLPSAYRKQISELDHLPR